MTSGRTSMKFLGGQKRVKIFFQGGDHSVQENAHLLDFTSKLWGEEGGKDIIFIYTPPPYCRHWRWQLTLQLGLSWINIFWNPGRGGSTVWISLISLYSGSFVVVLQQVRAVVWKEKKRGRGVNWCIPTFYHLSTGCLKKQSTV